MTSQLQKSVPPIINGNERVALNHLVEMVNLLQGSAADQSQRAARMFEIEQQLSDLEQKLVHLAGAEKITGLKTFSPGVVIDNGQSIASAAGAKLLTGPGGGTWSVQRAGATSAYFALNDETGAVQWTWNTDGNLVTTKKVNAGAVGVGNMPVAPLDILANTNGRLLARGTGTAGALTLDAVTADNSAYAAMHFTAASYEFAGGEATFDNALDADNGQAAASSVSSVKFSGGGYGEVASLLPRASAGNYASLVQTGDVALIFGKNNQNTGCFTLAPWNSNGWGLRFGGDGAWTFSVPGSAPAGSSVAVTSPSSLPGFTGAYGTASRSDIRFGNRVVQIGTSTTTGSPTQFLNVGTNAAFPSTDNAWTNGGSSNRWTVVYATTGSINTSDARDKTAVSPLTDAELAAAKALAKEVGTYQFLDAVAAKGADVARLHAGLTVQRAMEVMQGYGLDPLRYAFICHDSWDAQPEIIDPTTGELVQEGRAAGDRYSFRPDELLLFLARGFDARLSALENPTS